MIATATKTIREVFAEDHDRLDALFAEFRRLKWSDYPKAKESFKQFKFGLQRHIVWEERILFPMFESHIGIQDAALTTAMRAEHRKIGEYLEALHAKVRRAEVDSDRQEEELLQELEKHNEKEELLLYPVLDRLLPERDRDAIFEAMEQVPPEAYATCCGHHA